MTGPNRSFRRSAGLFEEIDVIVVEGFAVVFMIVSKLVVDCVVDCVFDCVVNSFDRDSEAVVRIDLSPRNNVVRDSGFIKFKAYLIKQIN